MIQQVEGKVQLKRRITARAIMWQKKRKIMEFLANVEDDEKASLSITYGRS
jgi:hypothetical protein